MGRPGLTRNPKFRRLADALGSKIVARGALELLWDVVYETAQEVVGDALDVELAAEWEGDRGALAAALVSAGFVDVLDDGRLAIHDLWSNCPAYVLARARREEERRERGKTLSALRSEAGKRGAAARWHPATDGKCMASDCQVATTPAPPPPPPPAPPPFPPSPSERSPRSAPGGVSSTDRGETIGPPASRRRQKFVAPTVEEVAAHVAKKGYHFSADAFIGHYQANGWRVGRNAMRDWRGACVSWEHRWLEEHGQYVRKRGDPPPGSYAVIEDGRTRAVSRPTVDYDEVARRRMAALCAEAGGDDG
jgi:hypothetical protein